MPFFAQSLSTKAGELMEVQILFGEGDIGIASATADDKVNTVVLFSLDTCKVPGVIDRAALGVDAKLTRTMTRDDMAGPVVRMQFERVESVDALIRSLQNVRAAILAGEAVKKAGG